MANNPTGSGITAQELLLSKLPQELPFTYLEELTKGFSQVVGTPGALGTVYKGFLDGGGPVIAVKKHEGNAPGTRDQKAYRQNVKSIIGHSDRNVVKLLAFCIEVRKDATVRVGDEYFTGDIVETLFCYEYFPGGNLHTHLFGNPASNIDWNARFKIIKGICRGLWSLHMSPERIIHLNLKPQNILLDEYMVPKITDFVYARILGEIETRKNTISKVGSVGYKAPEYLEKGEISRRTDIYALGLMILEITTREKNSPSEDKKSARDYVDKVEVSWYPIESRRRTIMSQYPGLDSSSRHEVQLCIEIGLKCVNLVAKDRPTIEKIISDLSA